MAESVNVQAAKDRIKIALRELFRVRRAARKQGNAEEERLASEAIDALKAEHAAISGIDDNTSYKIVTDGFKEAEGKLQAIIDDRTERAEGLKRAKKAVKAVENVLGLLK